MKIESIGKNTFELRDTNHAKPLGQIIYKNVFSSKATLLIGSHIYSITSHGFFSPTMIVSKDNAQVANITMDWKGKMLISYIDNQTYTLKPTGFFSTTYELHDQHQRKLFTIKPHFVWKKFGYNYDILDNQKPDDILLLLLSIYATNYYINFISGMS